MQYQNAKNLEWIDMEIFLNFIQAISDSRYWLGPLLVICVYVALAWEIITTVQDEIEQD